MTEKKLVLAIYTDNNIYEYFLPGQNNRKINVDIPAAATGCPSDIALSLEVWNGVWQIVGTNEVSLTVGESAQGSVTLTEGLIISCKHRKTGFTFTIVIENNYDGYSDFDKYVLAEGTISIGRDAGNTIEYHVLANEGDDLVSGVHATVTVGKDGSYTLFDESTNGTFVNGERITGSKKLFFGDVIYIIGMKIVCLNGVIAINRPINTATITGLELLPPPPALDGQDIPRVADEYYQRSPRQIEHFDDETIEIEAPPNPAKSRRQPLIFTIGPAMTMLIPMATGVLFTVWNARQTDGGGSGAFMFMGIITSVTAAIIGIFWALASNRYSKRVEREEEEKRSNLYRAYLEKIRKLLEEKHESNKAILDRKYPYIGEYLSYARYKNRRLWERNVNHLDFLTVRLGQGNIPSPNEIGVPKERFSLVADELVEEPQAIKNDYGRLRDVPICLSLQDHNLIGIIGDSQATCVCLTQLMAVGIAAYHAYTDVRMAFIYNEKEAPYFDFARWLPHTWSADGSLRMMACDENGVGEVLYDLSAVLRERLEEREIRDDKARPLPRYIIFISDPALVADEAIMKYLSAPTAQMGVTVVMAYGQISRLPNNCTIIVQNDEEFQGYYSLDSSFEAYKNVAFDTVEDHMLAEFARELSSVRVRETHISGAPPQLLTFLDMYKTSRVEDLDVERRWLENRTYESMKAMIGYRGPDTPLYLDIHEKYHGPHGLVAGTTGSGKSEMLQAYILSLAICYHPYEVSFILIDYKGGGMAGSFEALPHIAGIITNLGGNQTNRALASINSEIKRRQAIFNEYKLKHIDGYIELYRAGKVAMPIPHLLIVADEFAELKKEQPDFVRELVSASRVGRSLGVHLILATQKPSGVVDDEIWGNSKFRLCLRVQDKMDSNEMIKRPDAAYISNAGRGYFQVGNDEIFETFQSGWSGARYEPDIAYSETKQGDAQMINLWGKPSIIGSAQKVKAQNENEAKLTQLEAAVRYVAATAKTLGITAIDNIWLPPLPKRLSLPDIAAYKQNAYQDGKWQGMAGELCPVIGLVDDPVAQRQAPVSADLLTGGHMIVIGSSGGGKTTFLQTILYSLVDTYSPSQLHIYIADFGSRTMGVFAGLPHVGGVVYDNETDKADKLIALLLKELNRRKTLFSEKGIASIKEYVRLYEDVPFIVFVIDNFATWSENCGKQEDNLVQLAREAAGYGIYLLVTCSNPSDIRNKIRQNINFGIGLQLADRFEYEEALGTKTEIVAEGRTPGRGLICFPKPLEFQTALCLQENDAVALNMKLKERFEGMSAAWTGKRAPLIPQVPADMSLEHIMDLPEFAVARRSPRLLPCAYDIEEAQVVTVDLGKTFCYTISGTPRSGKTNMLKVFMRMVKERGDKVYLYDSASRELESFARDIGADAYLTTTDEVFDFLKDSIIPEFARRKTGKAEFVQGGRKNVAEYLESEPKLFIFIHDITAFCETIYESERNMKDFAELMVTRGDEHMIYLFACVSPSDMTGDYNSKRFMRGFVAWKEGLHLGGKLDEQRVLDFDVPVLERGKKLTSGYGHMMASGATKRIVVPLAD